ncbi:MAG: hypothetical protein RLZZ206_2287 [Cyanobacteriota bacterium]|jgi:hypothetical protein
MASIGCATGCIFAICFGIGLERWIVAVLNASAVVTSSGMTSMADAKLNVFSTKTNAVKL